MAKLHRILKIMRNSWAVFCYPIGGANCGDLNMKMGESSVTTRELNLCNLPCSAVICGIR